MSDQEHGSDAAHVPDLPTLIRERLDRGTTLQALEDASGGQVKAARWSTLSSGSRLKEFPEPRTLAAIARALSLTEGAVVIATARALGLDMEHRGPVLSDRIPSSADLLPVPVQSAIVNLVARLGDEWPDSRG